MRTLSFFQGIVCFLLVTLPLGAEVFNLGELSREEKVSFITIKIASEDMEVRSLAETAFNAHGAFHVEVGCNASLVFNFIKNSPNEVELSIFSGYPEGKTLIFKKTLRANTWQEAVLQLCDIAVQKTTGKPGFFSGQIAFVGEKKQGEREIFMSDLFFQSVKQLTRDASDSIFPRWSPDGTKILYTGYFESGFPDIFMIDLNVGERKTVAAFSGINTGGTFSPRGDKTAMILSSSGTPELYIADKNGSKPHRITQNKALEASPCFNTKGDTVFFTSDELGGPQIYQLKLADHSITRVPTNISKYCAEPAVNPVNDSLLAFTSAVTGTFQIALYNFNEGKSRFLTQDNHDFIEPCWLNDGRHLVATHRVEGTHTLCIIDTQTGNVCPLHSQEEMHRPPYLPTFGNASMASFSY